MQPPIALRRADLGDRDVIVATFRAGLESYVEFAPAGWRPPEPEGELERTADLLGDPDTWATLALVAGEPVGHVAFLPARERAIGETPGDWRSRAPLPGVAHLWQLFVLPDWWGAGVAPALHATATEEMAARGYERARLYAPADHARGRRFYERRGWELAECGHDPALGLDLAEYRLELS